ncbi:uncharacterized protein AB675_2582 [Cyphellophora attinorum]|uniref:Uncharacterized protein n=1 Tax=Cyphellophora attinorum TaxID=1664694 RepID=A0A0N1P3C0_9EURO|nr:uncharacterized protein AB675_2582 [Phialophora attinorum]KPI45267.1 hypothetical protein AB675_2582 [Phialophora attinorum]
MASLKIAEDFLASLPDPDTLPQCTGCVWTEDVRARSERDARLSRKCLAAVECDLAAVNIQICERLDDTEVLINEVDNWEDMAILETEKSAIVRTLRWLKYLDALSIQQGSDPMPPQTWKYVGRLLLSGEWDHVPGRRDLYLLIVDDHGKDDPRFLPPPLLEVRLAISVSTTAITWHHFNITDPSHFAAHWNLLHNSGAHIAPVLLLDDSRNVAWLVEFLGQWLDLSPQIFIEHLWRRFGRAGAGYGVDFIQAPAVHGPDDVPNHPGLLLRPRKVNIVSSLDSTEDRRKPVVEVPLFQASLEQMSISSWHVGRLVRPWEKSHIDTSSRVELIKLMASVIRTLKGQIVALPYFIRERIGFEGLA